MNLRKVGRKHISRFLKNSNLSKKLSNAVTEYPKQQIRANLDNMTMTSKTDLLIPAKLGHVNG